MGVEQTQRMLNQIDKEILELEKKIAEEIKKEATKGKSINDINRSITKYTSESVKQTKQRQIQSLQSEIQRINNYKFDLSKRLADKKKKKGDLSIKLQKERLEEQKLAEKNQKKLLSSYQNQIEELSRVLDNRKNKALEELKISNVNKNYEESEKYDVFISHAWEDKETFVIDLIEELRILDIKPWYDKERMGWGDSMRVRMDDGLKKSKFGIVVISPNYIDEGKYWTKAELDGLFQLESANQSKILPIWHNITKKEILKFSPLIANKFALSTTQMTPKEIANEMKELLK